MVSRGATATPRDETNSTPVGASLQPLRFCQQRATSITTGPCLGENNASSSLGVFDATKRGRGPHLVGDAFGPGRCPMPSLGRGGPRVTRCARSCATAGSFGKISSVGFGRISGCGENTSGGAYYSAAAAACCATAAAGGYVYGVSCAGSSETTSPTEVKLLCCA